MEFEKEDNHAPAAIKKIDVSTIVEQYTRLNNVSNINFMIYVFNLDQSMAMYLHDVCAHKLHFEEMMMQKNKNLSLNTETEMDAEMDTDTDTSAEC